MGTILHYNDDYEEALNCYDQSLNVDSEAQDTSLVNELIGLHFDVLVTTIVLKIFGRCTPHEDQGT